MRREIILFFIVLCTARFIIADIAPFRFHGNAIFPVSNTTVIMKKETVDIYYGDPYRVKAVFYMENNSTESLTVPTAFPVTDSQAIRMERSPQIYSLKVNVDGNEVAKINKPVKPNHPRLTRKRRRYSPFKWFTWDTEFKPGQTVVEVIYTSQTSPSYSFPFENLYYVFSSGSKWKDSIGYARLTVHFPKPFQKAQIMPPTTPGYHVNGKTVTWEYRNFEPTKQDDWHMEWIPRYMFNTIHNFKTEIKKNSGDHQLKIQLARYYLDLCSHKGIGGYTPNTVTYSFFEKNLVGKIQSPEDKNFVRSMYQLQESHGKKVYKEHPKIDEEDEQRIRNILLAIDYFPERFYPPFLQQREPQRLLEDVLKADPSNEEAWITYLSYYYKMHYMGTGARGGALEISQKQINKIREAHKRCPWHEGINLWYQAINEEFWKLPTELGKISAASGYKRKIFIFYGNSESSYSPDLSKETIDFLLKFYAGTDLKLIKINDSPGYEARLVLKKDQTISTEDKKKLVDLLKKARYFQHFYGERIRNYNEANGIDTRNVRDRIAYKDD